MDAIRQDERAEPVGHAAGVAGVESRGLNSPLFLFVRRLGLVGLGLFFVFRFDDAAHL